MDTARKRRKWDVAAPGGMPLTGNRAGIGANGAAKSLSGFITPQGYQSTPTVLPDAAFGGAAGAALTPKPGQSVDQATIARAQQGAQAIVERINAVRTCACLVALQGVRLNSTIRCSIPAGITCQRSAATDARPG